MREKVLRMLMSVAVLLVGVHAFAYDFEVDGIYYNLINKNGTTVEVTGGKSEYKGDVVIPSTVTYNGVEYTVTKIGNSAFKYSEWKSLGTCRYTDDVITGIFTVDAVTYDVEIQESKVTPGMYRLVNPYGSAYPYNAYGSYDTSKTYYMYIDATNPNEVVIPTFETGMDWGYGQISIVSTAYFYLNNGNAEMAASYYGQLKDGVISYPQNGMAISLANYNNGSWMYANRNGWFSVVLPSATANAQSVKAEDNKKAAKVAKKLRDNAEMIETKATPKADNARKMFRAVENGEFSANGFRNESISKLNIEYIKKSTNSNDKLRSVTIPNTVTTIGEKAFMDCSGLTSITIPSSVISIHNYAFANCTGLTEVNFNAENCQMMGYDSWTNKVAPVFYGCSNLTKLNIGNNVKRIPECAFFYCTGVKEVTIPESVIYMGGCAFAYCSELSVVNMNANIQTVGASPDINNFFMNCDALTTANIGENVTYISSYLFMNCKALSTINFSDSVESIYSMAFSGCTSLKSVIIPESVTGIDAEVFTNCTGLTTFNIPKNVYYFSSSTLMGCSNLTEITVDAENANYISIEGVLYTKDKKYTVKYPEGREGSEYVIDANVEYINSLSFYNAKNLTNVVIPNGVKAIGVRAFYGCENITNFSLPSTVTSIYAQVFMNTAWYDRQGDGVLYLDDWCLGYKGAPVTGILSIKDGPRGIAGESFMECDEITEVVLPNSLVTIGNSAFYRCTGLKEMVIPNSVIEIEGGAFGWCENLTKIVLPKNLTEIAAGVLSHTALTEITIPSTVTKIGEWAFQECKFTTLEIPNSVTEIDQYAFSLCYDLTSVTLPNTITKLSQYTFWNCGGLTSVTIPKSVEEMEMGVFYECTGLKSVKSLNPEPPVCGSNVFEGGYDAVLEVPVNAKEAYSVAAEWSKFANIIETAIVDVMTKDKTATFEIPVIEGAVAYTVNVYSDEAMTELVATTNYDANGKVIVSTKQQKSTTLELSINGFNDGKYYYEVLVKSETGETLGDYTGEFVIDTLSGVNDIIEEITEEKRYDASGKSIVVPVKGVNIVIYSNGAVKKVLVK